MPKFGPISRKDLVAALRSLGFEGPYSGGNHEFMVRESKRVYVPNPHGGDIAQALLSRLLKQAGISRDEWEGT